MEPVRCSAAHVSRRPPGASRHAWRTRKNPGAGRPVPGFGPTLRAYRSAGPRRGSREGAQAHSPSVQSLM